MSSPGGDAIRIDKVASPSTSLPGVVLLACGSFNPPHNVHLRMLELAKEHLEGESKASVLGAYMSPVSSHYAKAGLVGETHRIAMCEIATEASPFIMVDDWEARQPEWSRTLDVLHSVRTRSRATLGSQDLRVMIVCGSDLIESFTVPNLWSEAHLRSLVVENGIVCISRTGYNGSATLNSIPALVQAKEEWNVHFVENDFMSDLSSTKLRKALAGNESIEGMAPQGVADYIRKHSLYKS